MKPTSFLFIFIVLFSLCTPTDKLSEPTFDNVTFSNQASNWWARHLSDLDGDGIKEIVLQNNNAYGGWLGYLSAPDDSLKRKWELTLIADTLALNGTFAAGDMQTADVDNDGDVDVFGFVHGGEWESTDPTRIYWFENPSWEPSYIGQAPAFVKDVEAADFNDDGKIDLTVITFDHNSLQVFTRNDTGWMEAVNKSLINLHEGMAVGDIDGDGYTDIATNGYWLKSPGDNISDDWMVQSIDEVWHNQDGDWSRNATKNYCADIDGDGQDEVFISHSERKNYPVAMYDLTDVSNNVWEKFIIDTIDACHTLQVRDFNNDGLLDILAGENQMRWSEDDPVDPVNIYLNKGNGVEFEKLNLTNDGIYNGLSGDIDNDQDMDILRLPGHSAEELEGWFNKRNDAISK
jgi:hypothetical protein